jgi:hypothetical protein
LQKLDVPGCEDLEGRTLHSLAMRILARQHVLKAMGRTPRALNEFEQKAMYCDIAARHGEKTNCKELVKAHEGAWAQSQGDQPGFPKTPEEKAFQADLLSWHGFHESMLIGEVIPYFVRYLKENPSAEEHNEFDHVLATSTRISTRPSRPRSHIKLVVSPTEGGFALDLYGDLAGILALASNAKQPSGRGAGGLQVSMVAGAGFEPAAFRL